MPKTIVAGLSTFFITMYMGICPVLAEITQDKARVFAANHGRKCSVDMTDAKVKCRGRPLRSLASAKELISDGKLISNGAIGGCNINKAVWAFEWRAFPGQTPILVDAQTGRLVDCRP